MPSQASLDSYLEQSKIFQGMAAQKEKAREFDASRSDEVQAQVDLHKSRVQALATSQQEYRGRETEIKQQEAERKLMQASFPSKAFDKNVKEDYNSSQGLANKYIQAGQNMMHINPTKGLALIKEGEDLKHKGEEDQLKAMQVYSARHEAIAGIAANVTDQDSLNQAVQETAKVGGSIPKQFRVWNPATAEFLKSQVKGSKTAKEALELDLRIKASNLSIQKEERLKVNADKESLRKERKDANLRNNVGKVYKEPKFEDVAQTVLDLTAKSEDFADMKPADRRQAALDYGRRAYEHQKEGITDPTLAYAMAEEDVLSRVKDGKYEPYKGTSEVKGKESKPVPTEADKAYLKAHPEFAAKYKEHFGI